MGIVKITIIEEISSNRFIMKCARCDGTGKGYYSTGKRSNDPCRVCNGKGMVLVEIDGSLPFVPCARCDGTGRGYYSTGKRSTDPCYLCKGIGAQPISGEMQIIK